MNVNEISAWYTAATLWKSRFYLADINLSREWFLSQILDAYLAWSIFDVQYCIFQFIDGKKSKLEHKFQLLRILRPEPEQYYINITSNMIEKILLFRCNISMFG